MVLYARYSDGCYASTPTLTVFVSYTHHSCLTMASIAFALTFWYDRNAFQYSPATLRYRTRYIGGQYMKFTMFAAGQNADPATKMSHHVSSNFCFASVSPFPSNTDSQP